MRKRNHKFKFKELALICTFILTIVSVLYFALVEKKVVLTNPPECVLHQIEPLLDESYMGLLSYIKTIKDNKLYENFKMYNEVEYEIVQGGCNSYELSLSMSMNYKLGDDDEVVLNQSDNAVSYLLSNAWPTPKSLDGVLEILQSWRKDRQMLSYARNSQEPSETSPWTIKSQNEDENRSKIQLFYSIKM